MGFIIYGRKTVNIGYDEFLVKCPACESSNWADIMVVSSYYHMYWIPIFPYEKEANIICRKCGLKRYEVPFTSKLISNFEEVKGKFRHPWYTYLGLGILAAVILSIIISLIKL